jgi:hypothetical protein
MRNVCMQARRNHMYLVHNAHTSRRDHVHNDHCLMTYSRDCDRSNT